jgi:hypothetical protein
VLSNRLDTLISRTINHRHGSIQHFLYITWIMLDNLVSSLQICSFLHKINGARNAEETLRFLGCRMVGWWEGFLFFITPSPVAICTVQYSIVAIRAMFWPRMRGQLEAMASGFTA